jgi:hypothetical protein
LRVKVTLGMPVPNRRGHTKRQLLSLAIWPSHRKSQLLGNVRGN